MNASQSRVSNRTQAGYSRYTKSALMEAIAQCQTWSELCAYFGKSSKTGSLFHIKRRARQLQIPCEHLDRNNKYTKEVLQRAVSQSSTWAAVCDLFGIKSSSGTQSYLIKRAQEFGIETTHFKGRGWAAGKSAARYGRFRGSKPIEEYLILNGPKISNEKLKWLLIKAKLKQAQCEWCGTTEWLGTKVILELDHINMNKFDLRIDNLQLLCPNCHAVKTAADLEARSLPSGFTIRGPVKATET